MRGASLSLHRIVPVDFPRVDVRFHAVAYSLGECMDA